jgi:aryl-alcohol dehydrogenase-like predicted oxidoreductase
LLADRPVHRVGFGAMQFLGPGVLGPPAHRGRALAVRRRAVEAGVDHLDTARYYGPNVANGLIREALYPYPDELVRVSKVGAARDEQGRWLSAQRPGELRAGVEANLISLGLDQIPAVNLRRNPEPDVPFAEQLDAMKELREEGLIGAIGLSNVNLDDYHTVRAHVEVACVQNAYNLASRGQQPLLDTCQADGVPFVPFFPLGSSFAPESPVLNAPAVRETASRLGAITAQVALAWLLAQVPTVLLIPGTSSVSHLEENLAAAQFVLDGAALAALDQIGS